MFPFKTASRSEILKARSGVLGVAVFLFVAWTFITTLDVTVNDLHRNGKHLATSIFLLIVDILGLAFMVIFLIVEGLCRRLCVTSYVWFEITWTGLLAGMEIGAIVLYTLARPSFKCADTDEQRLKSCLIIDNLVFYGHWVLAAICFLYVVGLLVTAIIASRRIPGLWTTPMRQVDWDAASAPPLDALPSFFAPKQSNVPEMVQKRRPASLQLVDGVVDVDKVWPYVSSPLVWPLPQDDKRPPSILSLGSGISPAALAPVHTTIPPTRGPSSTVSSRSSGSTSQGSSHDSGLGFPAGSTPSRRESHMTLASQQHLPTIPSPLASRPSRLPVPVRASRAYTVDSFTRSSISSHRLTYTQHHYPAPAPPISTSPPHQYHYQPSPRQSQFIPPSQPPPPPSDSVSSTRTSVRTSALSRSTDSQIPTPSIPPHAWRRGSHVAPDQPAVTQPSHRASRIEHHTNITPFRNSSSWDVPARSRVLRKSNPKWHYVP